MSHYIQLTNLPTYNGLFKELNNLIENGDVEWPESNQICLNSIIGHESNYKKGTGSLHLDWDNAVETVDEYGHQKIVVPPYETPLEESDFTVLCNQFKGTLFEDVYTKLTENYKVGRVRIMKSKSKTCLTWHVDITPRIHFPIKTQEGCFMIIEDEVKHLPQETWWYTNTVLYHTAFNGSKEDRIHLVATILDKWK
jgi:hypothetical protein